ncbi:MAG: hypothetical protein C0508_04180, partial [Cyanobacteria bacterium PR.023]|nr:hypothetical protein [Cyanobacteria bacterium PR.023]
SFYAAIFLRDTVDVQCLFKCCHEYLYQNPTSMIARLLQMVWDYTGSDFDVRALILGVAIEGIAKDISSLPGVDEEFANFSDRVVSNMVAEMKEADQERRADLERLIRLVGQANQGTAKQTISNAAKSVNCIVTSSELKAWGKIRNQRGHGLSFSWEFPTKKDWANYFACVDLVNKLWLGAVLFPNPNAQMNWSSPFASGENKTI